MFAGYFDGVIDELRVSTVARSAEWISTCFNNQVNTSLFMSFGSEENIPDEPVPDSLGGGCGVPLRPRTGRDLPRLRRDDHHTALVVLLLVVLPSMAAGSARRTTLDRTRGAVPEGDLHR